jgi:hypothetical protein
MPSDYNFDKAILESLTDGIKTYSPEEFQAISIVQRVEMLCRGQFKFYKNGNLVPAIEALRVSGKRGPE